MASTVTLSMVLRFLFQIFGGIIALFFISWQLTLALLIPIPFLAFFGWLYGRFVKRLGKRIQEALAKVKRFLINQTN